MVSNFGILSKFVYSVLNYIFIRFVHNIPTGKGFGVFFYSRYFGFNRTGIIRAFAVLLIEADITGLQCCGGSSQAVGNLHITGQVAFAVYVVAVGQLACKCVQHVGYAVLVIHCNTGVIGNHAYNGACCSTLDNGVACCVVFCCFTVAGMSVEDIGIAAVVADSQAVAVLLEDVACFCFALAANQFCYMAACPFYADLRILNNLVNNLVVPGCAVLQPQVCRTGKGQVTLSYAITEAVLNNTGQAGFICGQAKVNFALGAMNIRNIHCTGSNTNVTLDGYIILICAGNIAVFIFNDVHINYAVFSSDSGIANSLSFLDYNAAALNGNLATAGISKQAVGIALEVYITVNCNSAALAVSHAASCVQAACTVVIIAAVIAFNIQLNITVYNNITFVINTDSISIAVSSNIQLAVNSQLSILIGNIDTLQAAACNNIRTGKLHL